LNWPLGGNRKKKKVKGNKREKGKKKVFTHINGGWMAVYDFLERCKTFALGVFSLLEKVPKTSRNIRISDQLYRCVPSVGANYNEAADSLGKRDRLMKLKTSRREASESKFFLDLLYCPADLKNERAKWSQEARELTNILSAMIVKAER
jgi:four helix bundle protein